MMDSKPLISINPCMQSVKTAKVDVFGHLMVPLLKEHSGWAQQ